MLLARELQDSQDNANSQLDMMLGMMHIDPLQLVAFLDTAETGLKLVNTILKEPARTDAEFRKKLSGLLRELHAIKGEASALNLRSVASRVHALEDMVSECKKKPELSGNDFLPMVLKLDELLVHLRGVREMAARLSALKDTAAGAAAAAAAARRNCRKRHQRRAPHGRQDSRAASCARRWAGAPRGQVRRRTARAPGRGPGTGIAIDGRAPGARSRQALQPDAQRARRRAHPRTRR